jgi:folate-binding protein YgfZ
MKEQANPIELLARKALWIPREGDLLLVVGKEGRDFLHRMSTAELASVPPGQARATVFVTEKGRIKAVAYVVVIREEELRLVVPDNLGAMLRGWLQRFVFLEDVRFAGPQRWYGAEIQGRDAAAVVRHLGLEPPAELRWGVGLAALWEGADVYCFRLPPAAPSAEGFLLVVPETSRAALHGLLREALGEPLGEQEAEALGILAGYGRHGAEWTEEYNPWEAGLGELVSLTKGCYIGQEVIARLDTYGKVQRQLVQLRSSVPLAPGSSLYNEEGQAVGTITSAAFLPWENQWVALGYVRRQWAQATQLWTEGEDRQRRALDSRPLPKPAGGS